MLEHFTLGWLCAFVFIALLEIIINRALAWRLRKLESTALRNLVDAEKILRQLGSVDFKTFHKMKAFKEKHCAYCHAEEYFSTERGRGKFRPIA